MLKRIKSGHDINYKNYRMINITPMQFEEFVCLGHHTKENITINGVQLDEHFSLGDCFPVENIVKRDSFSSFPDSFVIQKNRKAVKGVSDQEAEAYWVKFIDNSIIPQPYKYSGLHYGGFIQEADEWCLPSWIWTNAAVVRMYCRTNQIEKAKALCDLLIENQSDEGYWVVRYDYHENGLIPVVAPNDSAYIANNACLEVFLNTNEKKYLESAQKCAQWIMKSAKKDGMVYVGYDISKKEWIDTHNIVDVGFTAGLFSNLFKFTKQAEYKEFLATFVDRYVSLFYDEKAGAFSTALDKNENRIGGMFGRGQAWALEGLIPAYSVLQDYKIRAVIQSTVDTLLKNQNGDGSWHYNLQRKFLGKDCKSTPIIALSLLNWYGITREQKLLDATKSALNWCIKNTVCSGKNVGGIFDYSFEGAVVHSFFTNTAFVYSSAYAIELKMQIEEVERGN